MTKGPLPRKPPFSRMPMLTEPGKSRRLSAAFGRAFGQYPVLPSESVAVFNSVALRVLLEGGFISP